MFKKNFIRVIAIILTAAQLADPRLAFASAQASPLSSRASVLSTQAFMIRPLWFQRAPATTQRRAVTGYLYKLRWVAPAMGVGGGVLAQLWKMSQATMSMASQAVAPLREITFSLPYELIVHKGETLSGIFGLQHYQAVADFNRIAQPNHIVVNQVIKGVHTFQVPNLPSPPDVLATAQIYQHPILHEIAQQVLIALHPALSWIASPGLETAGAAVVLGAATLGGIYLGWKTLRPRLTIPALGIRWTNKTIPALIALLGTIMPVPAQQQKSAFLSKPSSGFSETAERAATQAKAPELPPEAVLSTTRKELDTNHRIKMASNEASKKVAALSTAHVKFGGFAQGEIGTLADSGRLVSYGPYLDLYLHWSGSPADRSAARDDARSQKIDHLANSEDDYAQFMTLIDALVRHDQFNRSSIVLRDLRPTAQQILDTQQSEEQHGTYDSVPEISDVVGRADRAYAEAQRQAALANQDVRRLAKLPVETKEGELSDTPLTPEFLATFLPDSPVAAFKPVVDPAVERSALNALTVLQNSQTQIEADQRSAWRRYLPSDLTIRFNPNLRTPAEMGTPFFWMTMINPAWTRVKRADWKSETDKLKAAQQTLLDDRQETFLRNNHLLLLLRSTYQEILQATVTRDLSLKGASEKDRPLSTRDKDLRTAINAQQKLAEAARQWTLSRVVLLGLGFSPDALNGVMTDTGAGSEERIATVAADRTFSLVQTTVHEDVTKAAKNFKVKNTSGNSASAQKYRAYETAVARLAATADQPLDWKAALNSESAPTLDTLGSAQSPDFATTPPPTVSGDLPSTKGLQFQRPDPSAALLISGLPWRGPAPIPSTVDSNVIGTNAGQGPAVDALTGTFPLNITATFNSKSIKSAQSGYAEALARTQATLDQERKNAQLWKEMEATLTLMQVNYQLKEFKTWIALVAQDGLPDRPQREAELRMQMSELETQLLRLKQSGAKETLSREPDGLPKGFDPRALFEHDLQQLALAHAISKLNGRGLKQLPIALGGQVNRNATFSYVEPDVSGLILSPLLHAVSSLFSSGTKQAVQDLTLQAARLEAEGHLVSTKNAPGPAKQLLEIAHHRVDQLQENMDLTYNVAVAGDRTAEAQATINRDYGQVRQDLWSAQLEEEKAALYYSIIQQRYNVYDKLFNTSPSDPSFGVFFGKDPAVQTELVKFREEFKQVWDGSAGGRSLEARLADLQVQIAAQLPSTVQFPFFNGLAAGPFGAATIIPPSADNPTPPLVTVGLRANVTANPGHRPKGSAAAETAKRAELAAAASASQANLARQVPVANSMKLASEELEALTAKLTASLAKAPQTDPTDVPAKSLINETAATADDYGAKSYRLTMSLGSLDKNPSLAHLDTPFSIHTVLDPEALATKLVLRASSANGASDNPSTFPFNFSVFGQEGFQNRKAIGWSTGGNVTTGAVMDPRRPKLKRKEAEAQALVDKRNAELEQREAHRQVVTLAEDLNRSSDAYLQAQRRWALANANYEAMVSYLQRGLLDRAEVAPALRELIASTGDLALLKGHLVSLEVALKQAAGLASEADVEAKAAELGLNLVTYGAAPTLRATVFISPAEEKRLKYERGLALTAIGTTANKKTRVVFSNFVRNNNLGKIPWRDLTTLSKDIPFYSSAPSAQLAQRRKIFIANLQLAGSISHALHPVKSANTDSAVTLMTFQWAVENRPAMRQGYRRMERGLAFGQLVLGERWTGDEQDNWVSALAAMDDRHLALLNARARFLDNPESIQHIQTLMALTGLPPLTLIQLVAERRATLQRAVYVTPEIGTAQLHTAATLLRAARSLAPEKPLTPTVLTQALDLANGMSKRFSARPYQKRFGAFHPSVQQIDGALSDAAKSLTPEDLKHPKGRLGPPNLSQVADLLVGRAALILDNKSKALSAAGVAPARLGVQGRIIRPFLLRFIAPLIIFAATLGGLSPKARAQTPVTPPVVSQQNPDDIGPTDRPYLVTLSPSHSPNSPDELLEVRQYKYALDRYWSLLDRRVLLDTLRFHAELLSAWDKLSPPGASAEGAYHHNLFTQGLAMDMYWLLIYYPEEEKTLRSWNDLTLPWSSYETFRALQPKLEPPFDKAPEEKPLLKVPSGKELWLKETITPAVPPTPTLSAPASPALPTAPTPAPSPEPAPKPSPGLAIFGLGISGFFRTFTGRRHKSSGAAAQFFGRSA